MSYRLDKCSQVSTQLTKSEKFLQSVRNKGKKNADTKINYIKTVCTPCHNT